jgi:chromosome segregation ATPase
MKLLCSFLVGLLGCGTCSLPTLAQVPQPDPVQTPPPAGAATAAATARDIAAYYDGLEASVATSYAKLIKETTDQISDLQDRIKSMQERRAFIQQAIARLDPADSAGYAVKRRALEKEIAAIQEAMSNVERQIAALIAEIEKLKQEKAKAISDIRKQKEKALRDAKPR